MGYRIAYDSGNRGRRQVRHSGLAWAFFALFLVLVCSLWPEGREVLVRCLWPGEPEILHHAAELFLDSVECGLSFGDSAEVFCREVFTGAQLVK